MKHVNVQLGTKIKHVSNAEKKVILSITVLKLKLMNLLVKLIKDIDLLNLKKMLMKKEEKMLYVKVIAKNVVSQDI